MKTLTCEICGGTEILKQDGVFVCQECGTKYTVEEVRNLLGADNGGFLEKETVKIDQADTIKNYLEMAKISVESEDVAGVENYTTKVLELDPGNYEAWVYKAKMTGWGSSISNDKTKAAIVAANKAISLAPEDAKIKLADELMVHIVTQNLALIEIAKGISGDFSHMHKLMLQWITIVDSIQNVSVEAIKAQIAICKEMCDNSKGAFLPKDRIIHAASVGFNKESYDVSFAKKLASKIQKEEPDYTPPEGKKGGCYVATCVYGSYDCPEVWTLRRYRDYTLAETWYGRAFVKTYYAISPTLVKWFGHTEWFKKMWKGKLDRMVSKLKAEGVDSAPYEDRNW